MERRAARDQHFQMRAGRHEFRDRRSCVEHVLEVVQDEQDLFFAQVVGNCLVGRLTRPLAYPEHLRDLGDNKVRFAGHVERYEEDAVSEGAQKRCGRFQAKSRLSGTAGPGQRYQAHVFSAKQRLHVRELTHPPEKRGRRHAQVRQRLERRRVDDQRRVLVEDLSVERLQLWARVDAELLNETLAHVLVPLERFGLPAGAVEGEHELAARPFA